LSDEKWAIRRASIVVWQQFRFGVVHLSRAFVHVHGAKMHVFVPVVLCGTRPLRFRQPPLVRGKLTLSSCSTPGHSSA
jgi:hypothetical protein